MYFFLYGIYTHKIHIIYIIYDVLRESSMTGHRRGWHCPVKVVRARKGRRGDDEKKCCYSPLLTIKIFAIVNISELISILDV